MSGVCRPKFTKPGRRVKQLSVLNKFFFKITIFTAANGSQTHGRPCRHIQSALSTGDGLWPLPRHMWCRFRKVTPFARLCVFGGLCVDVTIGTPMVIFLLFDCLLTVFDEWYTVPIVKNTGVQIVTGLPRLYKQCTNGVPIVKNSQKTVKTAKWPLVYQSSQVYQDCTNSVPIVKKTVKTQSKQHKNDHWCTSRHRSTKTVPTV